VSFNGSPTFLGFSSGNVSATLPQRWSAMPFEVGAAGMTIHFVGVDYFAPAGSEPLEIRYNIFLGDPNRDIPPNDPDYPIISSGVLGLHGPGQADPRVPGDDPNDGFLHEFPFPAPVTLGPGLYYFSIYGDGLGMGNTTGFSNAAWLTGADLVPPSLERNYQWRSQSYPVPGFVNYTSPAIAPLPGQDPADIWNCSFTFYGPQIPGPGAASLLGLGLVAALRRRR
jgi:uncharacterized protein (TIGR03382 family)